MLLAFLESYGLASTQREAQFHTVPSIEDVREALTDRYAVDRELARGGMATVYLARDLKHDRIVALKVLHRELAVALGADRFLREIKVAAGLNHPHILPLFDSGSAGEFIYYAMPYVSGESLRARLDREGRLPIPEATHHTRSIASALDYAHRQGIIHRDIKPENVMLHEGEAMVMDFGIAKALTLAGSDTITQSGVMVGTPAYVSPEQASGDTLDARTDQYSLACVLYEMLTGERPFTGPTAQAVIARRLTQPVRSVKTIRDSVPETVDRALTRAMSIKPDDRYATVTDFANALEGVAPVARGNWIRRAAVVGALGAAAVLAYAIVARVGGLRANDKVVESIAVMPFLNETRDANGEFLSDGMTETLITTLSQLPALKVKARSSVFRYKGKNVSPRSVGDELAVQAVLLGRVTQRADELAVSLELVDSKTENVIWSQRYDRRSRDLVSLQGEIARDVSDNLRLTLSRGARRRLAKTSTANPEAYQLYLKGRFYWNKRTPEGFRRAIENFQQAIDKDPSFAAAYSGLADSYYLQGAYGHVPPSDAMPRAKAAAERALAIDDQLAEANASLGGVMMDYEWKFADAERHFRRAIALNPGYATAHQWLAELLSILGRSDEAFAEIKRAEDLDPLSLIISNVHGHVLMRARRYDEAIAQYRKTLDLDPTFKQPYMWLMQAYEQKGMYTDAMAAYRQAGPTAVENPRNFGNLGHLYASMGNRDEARRILAQLMDMSKTRYVTPYAIAVVYSGLGEKDQAIAWLEKGYVDRHVAMAWLKIEPKFDVLRSDPRFQDLMRRIGLPR